MFRTAALSIATGAVALLALATAPANAQAPQVTQAAQSAAICGQSSITGTGGVAVARTGRLVITGTNVNVRRDPFTNSETLRVRASGTRWNVCGFLTGGGANSYTDKCGAGGRNWFIVRVNKIDSIGLRRTHGYIPVTCARAL